MTEWLNPFAILPVTEVSTLLRVDPPLWPVSVLNLTGAACSIKHLGVWTTGSQAP